MKFTTKCALSVKGDRIEPGETVEMTAEEAARYGDDLVPEGAEATPEPEPVQEEKSLDEMSADELKTRAEELGLKKTGSKADLIERITLHLEGGAMETTEEGSEEELADE